MFDYSNERFAASLRAERARKNMSQGELAERSGVSRITISRYEDGSTVPSAENLCAMSGALGISPNVLLGWPKRRLLSE